MDPSPSPSSDTAKTGMLLVNLGTPDSTDAASIRRYLAEFLADPRVVDLPRALWLPLLHGIILPLRSAKTGRAYATIWNEVDNESPLKTFTRAQAKGLATRFEGETVAIDWAMRYGNPSIESRLAALKATGCTNIVIVPLYPQYSHTTTASVTDEVTACLHRLNWQPNLRIVPAFSDHPLYVSALEQSLHRGLQDQNPEQVILSFHGIPERYVAKGDPYPRDCEATATALRQAMGWDAGFAPLAYQSKFGRAKWLGPSTQNTIIAAAQAGKKNIAVITPGFVADCIETLEEIGIGLAQIFQQNGGDTLTLIPCLNDSSGMIDLLADIARREMGVLQSGSL
ncbi:MAG: ferrochelatase [Parvularculaceae bacterium]